MPATDNLRHLHDRLRHGLAPVSQLEDRLRERGDQEGKLAAFALVTDYLQEVVSPHIRAELAALYPEAKRVAGIDLRLVRQLIDNCEELERQVTRVLHDNARLRSGVCDNVSCRRHITGLVRLLRRHLQAVEEELLPHLDRELSDEAVYRLYERMEEAGFDEAVVSRVPTGAEAAVAVARRLSESHGIDTDLSFLGEYLSDPELVERSVAASIEACGRLGSEGLDAHLSVDPTAIGLMTSAELCLRNAERIARSVAGQPDGRLNLVMLDMEDLSLVEPTQRIHRELLARGLPVGITLQARLRRTAEDISPLLERPTAIRLVKGAFPLGPEHDYQGRRAVSAAYLNLASRMLTPEARAAGLRPLFATHDDALIRHIAAMAGSAGWTPDQYEFEMLVGIRLDLQQRLRKDGYSVRAHLPFGTASWPYAVLPVGEHSGAHP